MKKKPRPTNPKDPVQIQAETCQNPWRKCENTDIAVSIVVKGQTLPICSECWNEISESNREWGGG